MRKITEQSCQAFRNRKNFTSGNMSITGRTYEGKPHSITEMRLHGNLIASLCGNTLTLMDAGWQTVTTKERLNGLLNTFYINAVIFQKNYQWFITLDGVTSEWNGSQTFKI